MFVVLLCISPTFGMIYLFCIAGLLAVCSCMTYAAFLCEMRDVETGWKARGADSPTPRRAVARVGPAPTEPATPLTRRDMAADMAAAGGADTPRVVHVEDAAQIVDMAGRDVASAC